MKDSFVLGVYEGGLGIACKLYKLVTIVKLRCNNMSENHNHELGVTNIKTQTPTKEQVQTIIKQ